MSKIITEKKEAKLKGKQAKITKTKVKAKEAKTVTEEKKPIEKCKNYVCCCTYVHYPKHASNGEAQKCKILKNHVGHKAKHIDIFQTYALHEIYLRQIQMFY